MTSAVAAPRSGTARYGLLAFAIVVAAGVLRFWNLGSLGISHWDAGSFVAGPLGVGPYGKQSILVFYAPPLVPTLNRLAFALAGDTGALALHAALGTLTVAATWAFGRRAFGERAGLAAAAALAGMEFHLVYSRQPLTDVTFTLLFLLATWALWHGFQRGGRRAFALAGAACGAAMWTKYHGFFPLVAAGAVWISTWPRMRRAEGDGERWRAQFRGLLLAAVVALPFGLALLAYIESTVGIAEFRANRSTWLSDPGLYLIPATGEYVAQCLLRWTTPAVLVAALLGCVVALARCGHGAALVLAWLALFLATLPLYKNYPRLLVPMLVPLALLAGLGVDGALTRLPVRLRGAVGALAALLLLGAGALGARDSLAIADRGYAEVARFLEEQETTGAPDLLVLQHSVLPYLAAAPNPFLCYDEPEALPALRAGRFRFVVFDMRTRFAPEWAGWEARRRGQPEAGALLEIPNPLPDPFLVNVTDFATLDELRAGSIPADVATIRVHRP